MRLNDILKSISLSLINNKMLMMYNILSMDSSIDKYLIL